MNEAKLSEHASDEQLLEAIYGVGQTDLHIRGCLECGNRLTAMRESRSTIEAGFRPADEVSYALLAEQRRNVYARLEQSRFPLFQFRMRHWASAVAAVALVAGGLTVFEASDHHPREIVSANQVADSKVTDDELAADVSQFAGTPEPDATAPLEALFEE